MAATSSAQPTATPVTALAPSSQAEAKTIPDNPAETFDVPPAEPGGHIGVIAPKDVKQEYWYRPPDSKARKNFEKIAVMRAAGHDDEAIAKKLHTTPQSVRQYVYLAKKNGWADNEGEPVDLEAEMALNVDRKLVRNLNQALDGGMTNWQTHEVTLELAKRRKVVSDVQDAAGQQTFPSVVAIRIDMAPLGAEQQAIVEANVGGVPAFTEGQVIDGTQSSELGQARNGADQSNAKTV